MNNLKQIKDYEKVLVKYLKDALKNSKAKGLLCGLSGGIDSAVVCNLIKKASPKNCLTVFMGCHSPKIDRELAIKCAKDANIEISEVDLSSQFDAMINNLKLTKKFKGNKLALANIKPRLRMTTLYGLANELNYLVVGTGNLSEKFVGYFTKYGDGGVDLFPLINLRKKEVYQLASLYNIPQEIISREPSASLFDGQTDEKEMGFTYQELDAFLENKKISPKVKTQIELMNKRSSHKLHPVLPKVFNSKFKN